MSEPETREVVPVTPTIGVQRANLLPSSIEGLHYQPAIYTTIDTSKPEGKARLYDLVVEGGDNSKEYVNRTFEIADIVVHPVTIVNKETGELTPLPRTVILTTDGDCIQFVSVGIFACVAMMKDCGWMPFGPTPQKFQLKQIPLADGKSMYKLVRAKDKPAKK